MPKKLHYLTDRLPQSNYIRKDKNYIKGNMSLKRNTLKN